VKPDIVRKKYEQGFDNYDQEERFHLLTNMVGTKQSFKISSSIFLASTTSLSHSSTPDYFKKKYQLGQSPWLDKTGSNKWILTISKFPVNVMSIQ
jgi:hypothetical protein